MIPRRHLVLAAIWIVIPATAQEPLDRQDLSRQDLNGIKSAFRARNVEPRFLRADDRMKIDEGTSVMSVVDYLDQAMRVGIFVVQGADNHVLKTLDIADFGLNALPRFKAADRESIEIDLYGDNVGYQGSVRYFYSLSENSPAKGFRYGDVAVGTGRLEGKSIRFDAVSARNLDGWPKHAATITLTPRNSGRIPAYAIELSELNPPTQLPAPQWHTPDGLTVMKSPESWSSGFDVSEPSGQKHSYAVPVPTPEILARMRPKDPPSDDIQNSVGDVVQVASVLWFGNSFYNGEGATGVGGLGEFNLASRTYRMHYIPEIADWSVGHLTRDGNLVWMGLYHLGEGSGYSGGVASFNRVTGAARRYPIDSDISSTIRVGDTVYCGSSDGIFLIRGATITQLRFAPDRIGKLVMISRNIH